MSFRSFHPVGPLLLAVALATGCEKPSGGVPPVESPSPVASRGASLAVAAAAPTGGSTASRVDVARAHQHAHVEPLVPCKARGLEPLMAARKSYDAGDHANALSCAAQAAALAPDDPQSHSEKGAALSALGRFEEAQLSYARALAIDPDHLDGLLGAAHLYGVTLPSSRERDELAVTYSERGLELAEQAKEQRLVVEFALLSAMAFNDLGQARDALARAEEVLKLDQGQREARYERAVALFELCRFSEAKLAFAQMLDEPERSAHAHHHLGLVLEREGKFALAERNFERAQKLAPEDFPAAQKMSAPEFRAEVERAVAALPADMRRDLRGIPITAEELPLDEDLLSGEPPLSPAILGLFRGPPLGERCEVSPDKRPCRSVALYRKNLARAVRSREELVEQIRITLLHEVGHLRGEDDFELAARGLE